VASVAVWLVADKNKVRDIRIALGGVAPTPIRARKTESSFKGQSLDWDRIAELSETVMEEVRPITDVRGSAEYRKQVSAGRLATAVRQALGMEE
jgi:carbon-monoxide dehydrogenase medium subunit